MNAALTHLRYPPAGDRGVATYNRACRFGLDPGALDRADRETLCVVQIESAAAVADADDIAALDGVDVLFIGPRDLSHDLGVPGDITAPAYIEALDAVLAAARRHGKACGMLVADGAAAADPPRAGLVVPRHRLRLHPARRDHPDRARPSPHPLPLNPHDSHRKKTPPWLDTSPPTATPSWASA